MVTRREIEETLKRIAPRIPAHEFGAIVDHALDSTGLRSASPESAAWLSLVTYVRHVLTEYDDLLAQGYDADSARHFVVDQMQDVLTAWGARRNLGAAD